MRTHRHWTHHHPLIMALTDKQLAHVMDAARSLPIEKRDVYLQRIAAMLKLRGVTDADVADVAKLALAGLVQTADSSAA